MKPTQEQILSALNKLIRENKTELKTEKIELGVTDDLDSSVKELKASIKAVKSEQKAMLSFLKELKSVNKNLAKSWSSLDGTLIKANAQEKEAQKNLNKLNKAAKELGVNYLEIPSVKKYLDLNLDSIEKGNTEAKETLKIINKIGI